MNDFATFLNKMIAEYERKVEDLDHPLEMETIGEFLEPLCRKYLNRNSSKEQGG